MAGKQLNKKVKASSILETIVAMVIMVVAFSTAMVVLANVLKSSVSVTQIRASALLREQLEKVATSSERSNVSYISGDIEVRQIIATLDEHSGMIRVDLVALDRKGKNLAELHQIITDHAE